MPFNDDKRILIEILIFVEKVLGELVDRHITDDRDLFESAWVTEVKPHLDDLIVQFESIPNERSPLWRDLSDRGLTGAQLALKRARLAAISGEGVKKKILDIINTILGSIPGAESVKEFKEFAEEAQTDPESSIRASFF